MERVIPDTTESSGLLSPKRESLFTAADVGQELETSDQETLSDDIVRLQGAQAEMARQVDASLEGFLQVNDLLDQIQEFALLPVEAQVDFDYEDNDTVAYRVLGTPEGATAHFLVGLESFQRDDRDFNYLQLEIKFDVDKEPQFYRDALRQGPRVHVSIDYDEAGRPGTIALITEREIALAESRRQGMSAMKGRFTSGAGYKASLADPDNVISETFGIVDGRYTHGAEFGGISPLAGDLAIDPARVEALFAELAKKLAAVRREDR